MNDSVFLTMLLVLLSLLSLGLLLALLWVVKLLVTHQSRSLRAERVENQLLRNQLRTKDVISLNSLNYATGVDPSNSKEQDFIDDAGLAMRAIDEEFAAGPPTELDAMGYDHYQLREGSEGPLINER